MTIKQIFSAIFLGVFMTSTGLVVGITPQEANKKLKEDLAKIQKNINSENSKKDSEHEGIFSGIIDRYKNKVVLLDSDVQKKHLELVVQLEKKRAQLQFHTFMNQIHQNGYR